MAMNENRTKIDRIGDKPQVNAIIVNERSKKLIEKIVILVQNSKEKLSKSDAPFLLDLVEQKWA